MVFRWKRNIFLGKITKFLRQIADLERLIKIDEILSWAIRYRLKPTMSVEITLFKLEQWVTVPTGSDILLTLRVREQLRRTLEARGQQALWAVPLMNPRYL